MYFKQLMSLVSYEKLMDIYQSSSLANCASDGDYFQELCGI